MLAHYLPRRDNPSPEQDPTAGETGTSVLSATKHQAFKPIVSGLWSSYADTYFSHQPIISISGAEDVRETLGNVRKR